MRKISLLAGVSMIPAVHMRHMGMTLMASAPPVDGGGGGTGDSGGTGDNKGGNTGDSGGTGGENKNNTGQDFDLGGFWSEPKAPPKGEGDSGGGGNGNDGKGGDEYGKTLATQITNLKFDNIFDQGMLDEMNEGNLTNVNERIAAVGRESAKQSLIMSAQLMQRFGESLMARVEAAIAGKLNNRDDDATLLENFPAARDPAVKPMIQGVYSQALKHTNGDRGKAVALAKDMLKLVGNKASADFGFENPPGSREDTLGDGPRALVESLLARE